MIRAVVGLLMSAVFWLAGNGLWTSDNSQFPTGDASYFSNMTYTMFTDRRGQVEVSSLHGKRILGPFLTALMLKAQGVATDEPFYFAYDIRNHPREAWSENQKVVYAKIHSAWQVLNGLSYLALGIALAYLLPVGLNLGMASLLMADALLTPSLGLLEIFMPQMNDVITNAVFAWAMVALRWRRESLGLLLLGIAALGREQVLFLLPVVYLFFPFRLLPALGLALGPFAGLAISPLFPNTVPLYDGSSETLAPSTSPLVTYFGFLKYHLKFLFSQRGLIQPFSILFNLGAPLLISWRLGLLRQKRYLIVLGLGFVFMADRHMILMTLILAAALPESRRLLVEDPLLRRGLIGLVLFKVALILVAQNAIWLQMEHWFRLVRGTYYRVFFQLVWASLIYYLYRNTAILTSILNPTQSPEATKPKSPPMRAPDLDL